MSMEDYIDYWKYTEKQDSETHASLHTLMVRVNEIHQLAYASAIKRCGFYIPIYLATVTGQAMIRLLFGQC